MPVEELPKLKIEWKDLEDATKKVMGLENPDMIDRALLSRDETDRVSLDQVKQAFWNRCMRGVDPFSGPYRRFVGYSETLEDSGGRNTVRPVRIWLPQSVNEDFNLVLSLCDDGLHRCLTDNDTSQVLPPATKYGSWMSSVVPSTEHWHVYSHYGVGFDKQLSACGNDPYRDNVKKRGFASLRPPWLTKWFIGETHDFFKNHFLGFNSDDWVVTEPTPVDDGKVGWEELFGDGNV